MSLTLLSLDPGGHPTAANSRSATGASLWVLHEDAPIEFVEAWQIPNGLGGIFDDQRTMTLIKTADKIVCESFRDDGRTRIPDSTPLKIEGALLAIRRMVEAPLPIAFQSNVYKGHAPDALLKRTGLWQKGMPHANDAIRHAIAWAKVNGHRPTIEWLWPVPEALR